MIKDYKVKDWTNPIVNEADRPQRSASSMKEVFDSNSNQLRAALNNLIDALASGGAEDIGAAVEGMEGKTVATILAELKSLIDSTGDDLEAVRSAVLPKGDGTLFLADDGKWKMPDVGIAANGTVPGGEIGDIFVKKTTKVYEGEWKSPKALNLMSTIAYDADGDGIVDVAKSAKTLDGKKPDDFQKAIKTARATLLLSEWVQSGDAYLQTVSVSGITSASIGGVRISHNATDAQFAAWGESQPRITEQKDNQLTVSILGSVPLVDIPLEVWYA